jgi:hypothetical protein
MAKPDSVRVRCLKRIIDKIRQKIVKWVDGIKVVVSSVKLEKVLSEGYGISDVDKIRKEIMKWLT